MLKTLRQPKLWITAASLAFIAVALGQQSSQLRALTLAPHGWWWLSLGLGVTWLSILLNGLAWKVLLFWLGHLPEGLPLVPLFVRTNLLKYLPGGIWHLVERVRLLRPFVGGGPALAGVNFNFTPTANPKPLTSSIIFGYFCCKFIRPCFKCIPISKLF